MKLLKNSIVIFMILTTSVTASNIEEDLESGKRDSCNHRNLDKNLVNIYQDVEGTEDDYLRCSICMFRCCGNSSVTLSKLAIITSGFMTGLIAIPGLLDDTTKATIGTVSAVLSLSSIALLSFKRYSKKAIEDREEQLKEVLRAHGIDVGDE